MALNSLSDAAREQDTTGMEESLQTRVDRLGKERPACFRNFLCEASFIFSIVTSQFLVEGFTSGFALLIPSLVEDLDIPASAVVWPATAFSLLVASTLLLFGRLGDMFGGYLVYVTGLAWLFVWSIIAGFSVNPMMLYFARGFQGLGASATQATGIMLLGSFYRPGPRKNFVFALYGVSGIFGFFFGLLLAGIVGQYLRWGWFFWIGGILAFVTFISSIFSIPNDYSFRQKGGLKMDWPGSVLIMASLMLVIFSITESAHAPHGWATPYVPILFAIGFLLLGAAIYVETRVASQPLLPSSIFTTNKSFFPLVVAIMLLYGDWGIFIIYGTQYFQNIAHASSIQLVAWYTPIFVVGLVFAIVEGLLMHIVSGRIVLIVSATAALVAQLLLALIPHGASYWAWVLPATICSTIGVDLSFIVMTVYVTTMLPSAQQGLGGGLINSVTQLGIALCLGIADIIQTKTVNGTSSARHETALSTSYKNTFWLGLAIGGVSLVLMSVWGRVPRAKSDLTVDEKLELEQEARRQKCQEASSNVMILNEARQ